MGFFAVGVLFRQNTNAQRNNSKYMRTVYPIVAVIAILVFAYMDTLSPSTRLDYWTCFDCFSQFSWIVVLFFVSRTLVGLHGYEIGKASFTNLFAAYSRDWFFDKSDDCRSYFDDANIYCDYLCIVSMPLERNEDCYYTSSGKVVCYNNWVLMCMAFSETYLVFFR